MTEKPQFDHKTRDLMRYRKTGGWSMVVPLTGRRVESNRPAAVLAFGGENNDACRRVQAGGGSGRTGLQA
jgi:hypothetical protein